jgi:hypothetical protein
MSITGLLELMQEAFAGVPSMLLGEKIPLECKGIADDAAEFS